MNSKQIIGLAIIAGAGFLLYKNYADKKAAEERLRLLEQQYRNSSPPTNTPDWYKWINLIVTLFGTAQTLWAPGGPFYNQGIPDPSKDPEGWIKLFSQTQRYF